MPIVTNSDNSPKMNGDYKLSSMEDEESFVVLERLTANDPAPVDVSIQSLLSFPPSFPVFNNLTSNTNQNHSQYETVPVEPTGPRFDSNNISVTTEEIQKQLQEVLHENVNLKENLFQTNLAMKQHMSTVRLLQDRASEVQKNHQSKFEETKALILQLGSEKIQLQEANNSVSGELNKAKEEMKQLKEANLAFGNEMAKILSENDSLKKQLESVQENMLSLTESSKKASLQPTAKEIELHELAEQLSRKLEGVERSRRQQDFDIDRLKAQLGRALQELNDTQRKLALAENALQVEKEKSSVQVNSVSSSLPLREKYVKYEEILNQLKTSAKEESRCSSLGSWLATDPVQFEISELRRLLAEEQSQSIAQKESLSQAISTIHDLLGDLKKASEELELVKADHATKESHNLAYNEVQKKGFTDRLDALTAELVQKNEALAIAERHLASIQEAVRLENAEKTTDETEPLKEQLQILSKEIVVKNENLQANNEEIKLLKSEMERLQAIVETVPVLEEQAKIFQDDFETERKSRELLVAEKERLLGDFKNLEQRNLQLIDDYRKLQNGQFGGNSTTDLPANVDIRQEQSSSQAPPRPQDETASLPNYFYCLNPKCSFKSTCEHTLQTHVIACLQLTD